MLRKLVQSPNQPPSRYDLATLGPNNFNQLSKQNLDAITAKDRDKYFVLSTGEECTLLFAKLLGNIVYQPSGGANENTYFFFYGIVLSEIQLKYLECIMIICHY